jgi:uncharacterized protein YciI
MKSLIATTLFMLATCLTGLSQDYTVVFLNKNPEADKMSKTEVDKIMEGHTENRERLAKEGKLLAAGPFDGGGGLYIMKTTSVEEAQRWIADDPGIKSNRWIVEVFPYKPRVGGICPVGENYTMTNYTFVRFDAIVSKATAQNFADLVRQHDEYLKQIGQTGNVVTEAVFGEREGGILIMRGDVQRDVFDQDPAVQQGLIQFEIKKFYTAKGSFCEQ